MKMCIPQGTLNFTFSDVNDRSCSFNIDFKVVFLAAKEKRRKKMSYSLH